MNIKPILIHEHPKEIATPLPIHLKGIHRRHLGQFRVIWNRLGNESCLRRFEFELKAAVIRESTTNHQTSL